MSVNTLKCYLKVHILVLVHLEADFRKGCCKGLYILYCIRDLGCQIVEDHSMTEIRQFHGIRIVLQDVG